MKPFFIACLILVSLFTAGAMNQRTVSDISDSIRTQLNASQAADQQEQWETAERALSQADRTWQAHEAYLHVVIEHDEIDEAEALFTEVSQYARQRQILHQRRTLVHPTEPFGRKSTVEYQKYFINKSNIDIIV